MGTGNDHRHNFYVPIMVRLYIITVIVFIGNDLLAGAQPRQPKRTHVRGVRAAAAPPSLEDVNHYQPHRDYNRVGPTKCGTRKLRSGDPHTKLGA